MSPIRFILGLTFGILPLLYLIFFNADADYYIVGTTFIVAGAIAPVITMLILILYLKRRINGYTGDCCGAIFLLCELSYLLTTICLWEFL